MRLYCGDAQADLERCSDSATEISLVKRSPIAGGAMTQALALVLRVRQVFQVSWQSSYGYKLLEN